MLSELFSRNVGNQDARRIARNNGVWLVDLVQPCHQLTLDIQSLNDHFHNPVTISQLVEIIFDVADGDQLAAILRARLAGRAFAMRSYNDCTRRLRACGSSFQRRTGWRDDVEQHHRDADIGQMRGIPGPIVPAPTTLTLSIRYVMCVSFIEVYQ